MKVQVADSLTKVFPAPEEGERVLREGPARLKACRNERGSFQVVVTAGTQALRGVSVTISDFERESGGTAIPKSRAAVNLVGYVETRRPVYNVDRVGWWPDALLPVGPAEVQPERRQPFWITVHVPS